MTKRITLEERPCSRLIRRHRRALHRIPEVGFDLPEDAGICACAARAAERARKGVAGSGVLAYFDAGRAETTAFRCDMDALPIQEAAGLSLCIAAPRQDARLRPRRPHGDHAGLLRMALAHGAKLALQRAGHFPARGGDRAAARASIVESGALEEYRVRRIFAMHVQPGIPRACSASRPGAFMATSCGGAYPPDGRFGPRRPRPRGARRHACRGGGRARSVRFRRLPACGHAAAHSPLLASSPARRPTSCPTRPSFPARCAPSAARTTRASRRASQRRCAACAPLGVEAEVSFSEGYPPTINDSGTVRPLPRGDRRPALPASCPRPT